MGNDISVLWRVLRSQKMVFWSLWDVFDHGQLEIGGESSLCMLSRHHVTMGIVGDEAVYILYKIIHIMEDY